MIRSILLIMLMSFALRGHAQIEDENRNALPPGPARISGYVIKNGTAVTDAVVRLECILHGERQIRDFPTYGRGEYSVYIDQASEEVVITVLIDDVEVLRYMPEYFYEGSVQRKDLVIE